MKTTKLEGTNRVLECIDQLHKDLTRNAEGTLAEDEVFAAMNTKVARVTLRQDRDVPVCARLGQATVCKYVHQCAG